MTALMAVLAVIGVLAIGSQFLSFGMVLGIVGVLVVGAVVVAVVFYKIAIRSSQYALDVEIQIQGVWVPRVLHLHFYHWLPKFFHAFGMTLDDDTLLRGGPPERSPALPGWKPRREVMQRWQVGHEMSHFADQELEDVAGRGSWLSDVVYYITVGVHRMFQRWGNREEERRANERQTSIAAGTSAVIRAKDQARFEQWFPDNYDVPTTV